MLLLGLGIGMIASGIGIGARNIYTAGKEKGMENTELMAKQIQTQKAHINELIESEFELNKLVNRMNDTLGRAMETTEAAVSTMQEMSDKSKNLASKEQVKEVAEILENANKLADEILKSEADSLPDEITADDVKTVEDAKRVVDVIQAEKDAREALDKAEDKLADAIVDAGVTEDEKLAQLCAEAIREEEEAASAKRYKAAKKGGKK
jgi:hypothetical protein